MGERILLGRRFEDERGIRGWHITTWPVDGYQIDDYWIEAETYYEMLGWHISGYPGVAHRVKTGRPVAPIEVKNRDTILKTLAQWN